MPKYFQTKISRRIALKKLESLVERTAIWNDNYAKKCRVSDIVLVGSVARSEEKVGDVDVACEVEKIELKPGFYADLDEYLQWRKDVLGFAKPTDYHKQLHTVEADPLRFIKNGDGRIEILQWDQVELISLSLHPIVTLVKDGTFLFNSVENAIAAAKPITIAKAKNIIADGQPEKPDEIDGEYWTSYCITINHLPQEIGDLILERDGYRKAFKAYAKNNEIPDRIS